VSFVKKSIDCWSLRKTTIPIGQIQNETQKVKNENTFPIKFFLFLIYTYPANIISKKDIMNSIIA
jgi:hypothetical protein